MVLVPSLLSAARLYLNTTALPGLRPTFVTDQVAGTGSSLLLTNPAQLGFVKNRSISASVDFLHQQNETQFDNQWHDSNLRRVRFSQFGLLSAVPTIQGGMALAVHYSRPAFFDNIEEFTGTTQNGTDILSYINKTYGDLQLLQAGLGVQVAPRLSLGASLGFLFGGFDQSIEKQIRTPQTLEYEDDFISRNVNGFDFRTGISFFPSDNLLLSAMVQTPPLISFEETADIFSSTLHTDSESPEEQLNRYLDRGSMFSSFRLSFGMAAMFRELTLAGRISARLPYDLQPDRSVDPDSPARQAAVDGYAGAEYFLTPSATTLQLGVSVDEVDRFVLNEQYDLCDPYQSEPPWQSKYTETSYRTGVHLGVVQNLTTVDLSLSYALFSWDQRSIQGAPISENLREQRAIHYLQFGMQWYF